MKTYLVSLGSNENRTENMVRCRQLLELCFQSIDYSDMLETEPVGEGFNGLFYNQLAIVCSDLDLPQVKYRLKEIEKQLGRTSTDKSRGIVIIDLDVLAVDQKIIKSGDFARAYISCLLSTFGVSEHLSFYKEYLNACVSV
ncbi:2-amino-4-hydroxy-6-hydroxymethyldihydropteridine diphosphokinase [Dysgonomonas capnocytophagoides]|uniref:2-amino-4-hydroxy-6- hydroxymethyldihydropteridine diphosphokinase n=1 Tax=Dysgonomonas capnocytophagoides TaxID=45254 RepID=UPI002921F5E8|nr:hypothetical protein DCPSUM001_06120 [Dysgonomonas capnocytophagoides]